MKKKIHPKYNSLSASCSCGNIIAIKSTLNIKHLYLDICNMCHPFHTGTQRIINHRGRVNLFNKRFPKTVKNSLLNTKKK